LRSVPTRIWWNDRFSPSSPPESNSAANDDDPRFQDDTNARGC
jgi:hypothetical protein